MGHCVVWRIVANVYIACVFTVRQSNHLTLKMKVPLSYEVLNCLPNLTVSPPRKPVFGKSGRRNSNLTCCRVYVDISEICKVYILLL